MTKRNVFGGGETFGVKLRGSYEWQTGNKLDGSNSKINSYELGLTTTLTFPRVLFPTFSKRDMNFPASTTFRLYADQMNRARSSSCWHSVVTPRMSSSLPPRLIIPSPLSS